MRQFQIKVCIASAWFMITDFLFLISSSKPKTFCDCTLSVHCEDGTHPGFVPSKNMDDDIELFETAEEAVEWYKSAFMLSCGTDSNIAEAACMKALKAANDEQSSMEAHEAYVQLQSLI